MDTPLSAQLRSRRHGERRPASRFWGAPGSSAWRRTLRPCIRENAVLRDDGRDVRRAEAAESLAGGDERVSCRRCRSALPCTPRGYSQWRRFAWLRMSDGSHAPRPSTVSDHCPDHDQSSSPRTGMSFVPAGGNSGGRSAQADRALTMRAPVGRLLDAPQRQSAPEMHLASGGRRCSAASAAAWPTLRLRRRASTRAPRDDPIVA